MSLITYIADSTISLFGTGIVKRMLHTIGDVRTFKFDSRKSEVMITIVLKGEAEITSVRLGSYSIKEENGGLKIRFETIVTSKEWLTAAGDTYFKGRYFDVPERYAMEVKAVFGDASVR